jgi:hypothetical protein
MEFNQPLKKYIDRDVIKLTVLGRKRNASYFSFFQVKVDRKYTM